MAAGASFLNADSDFPIEDFEVSGGTSLLLGYRGSEYISLEGGFDEFPEFF